MKRIVLALLPIVLLVNRAWAHPGVGIVRDSQGYVYYTDLHNVWRITPEGELSIAVENVHTHELFIDRDDNLYGEHLVYEGEQVDRWNHRVWKRAADGTLTDVISKTEGFLSNYSFVRDEKGTMYWAERGETTIFRKRLPNGEIVDHARATLRNLRWMTSAPDGTLYFVDTFSLCEIKPDGTMRTVVEDLREERNLIGDILGNHHHVMGLWLDAAGNVYVAVSGSRCVKRVDPQGAVSIVARSDPSWAPSGGLVAPDGTTWLLEYGASGKVRVRRIAASGEEKIFAPNQ